MSGIRELHTRWDGVAGSPYWTTIRATMVGVKTATDLRNNWNTFLVAVKPNWHPTLTAHILPEVTDIESTTGMLTGTETVASADIVGTATGDMLPPFTQGLVKWSTDIVLSGRRLRGRTFIPGWCEPASGADGQPSAVVVTGMSAPINNFLANMGGEFVIYSRTHLSGGAVTAGTFWNKWAELRSRRD